MNLQLISNQLQANTSALTTQGAGVRQQGIVTPGSDEPFHTVIPKPICSAVLIPSRENYSKGFCTFSPHFLNLYQSSPFSHGLLDLFMYEKQIPL